MTYPPTGPNPSQSGGDAAGTPQYGAPQYGAPQYGAPQYGAPQYGGAPMPGYPAAPPPGGGQWGLQRPGTATAAGVLGIIFTTIGFFAGAFNVIVLTGAAESDLFAVVDGFPMVLYVIAAIGMLVASVMGFIGAIQLLSGKSNQMLILATIIYLASRVISLLADLIFADGNATGTLLVSALVGIVLAIVLIFLARGSDVQQWLEQKKAATSAGAF
ncbi:MAG: hypothetical protein ACK5MR_01750 [Cumulibacter sp.]